MFRSVAFGTTALDAVVGTVVGVEVVGAVAAAVVVAVPAGLQAATMVREDRNSESGPEPVAFDRQADRPAG